jgi:hypothetical protein
MVIENKIWSRESQRQTSDYAAAIERGFKGKKQYCILLSPYGSSGISKSFFGLSYIQLYECIEKALTFETTQSSRAPQFYLEELDDIINDYYR